MSKQSAITLDQHLALDKARAKAAIDAIKDRKHPMLVDPHVRARGKLRKKLGKELRPLFAALVERHYDPLYARSQGRNFARLGEARRVESDDLSERGIDALAQRIAALD